MATLLFKVAALTMKTLAKPMATQFEKYVMGHPQFRQSVLKFAQRIHKLEVSINRGAEGRVGGRVFVGDMTEEKAVQLASKVVSEGFVYTVGITVVLMEMNRKRNEDIAKKAKEEARRQEVYELHEQHLRAEKELKAQSSQMEALLKSMDDRMRRLELAFQLLEDKASAESNAVS